MTERPPLIWNKLKDPQPDQTGSGCPIDCAYCNQFFFNINDKEREVKPIVFGVGAGISLNTHMRVGETLLATISSDLVIAHLLSSNLYSPESNIILENFTDPGLDWPKTLSMMKMLVDNGHKGALITITKFPIGNEVVNNFKTLQEKGGYPIVVVSHSGLPYVLEPCSSKVRIDNMKRLHEAGVPVIHSLRPLIQGINTDNEQIKNILEKTAPYAFVTVPGGLVIDKTIIDEFVKRDFPLSNVYTDAQYTRADIWPTEEKDMSFIIEFLKKYDNKLALKFMSCAISWVMTGYYQQPTPDRMAQWSGFKGSPNNWQFCKTCCPELQIKACRDHSKQPIEQIISKALTTLKKLGYDNLQIRPATNKEGVLLIEGVILPEEILYGLKGLLGFYINHFPDKELLITSASNVIKKRLNTDFTDKVKELSHKDDVWHIVFNPDVSSDNAHAILSWIRGDLRVPIVIDD